LQQKLFIFVLKFAYLFFQVRLNIGGQLFVTTLATLTSDRNSLFALMFSGRYPIEIDQHGCIFIDRYEIRVRSAQPFAADF
jgi:hypothetical protein